MKSIKVFDDGGEAAEQSAPQEWNPVEAMKAAYPKSGLADHEIAQGLQDPAKFRAAFPEYQHATDEQIKTNIGKFVDNHPEYSPSGVKRFTTNLKSESGVVSGDEGKSFLKNVVTHPYDTISGMIKGAAKAQGDTGNLAIKEFGEGNFAAGTADLIDSALPLIGPGLSRAGHKLESGDYAGGAGATLGVGLPIVAGGEMESALKPEAPPIVPSAGRSLPLMFSKMRTAGDAAKGVSSGLPSHPGSFQADPLAELPVSEARRAAETGEALGIPLKKPAAKANAADALANILPRVDARPEAETGEALATRKVPDQPITPEAVSESRGVPKSEYDKAISDAVKAGPAWTPAKAAPVMKALKAIPDAEWELHGSVGAGKDSANDLDIHETSGNIKSADPVLKSLGFTRVGETAHGETWENTRTGQHVDTWRAKPNAAHNAEPDELISTAKPGSKPSMNFNPNDEVPSLKKETEKPAVKTEGDLSESEKRGLAHRVGKLAAEDTSPTGLERNMRFLKVTNQQLADFANENGPDNPSGPNEKWSSKDFSRRDSKGLHPEKERVFQHIQNNIPHADFMKLSKDWGRSAQQ